MSTILSVQDYSHTLNNKKIDDYYKKNYTALKQLNNNGLFVLAAKKLD